MFRYKIDCCVCVHQKNIVVTETERIHLGWGVLRINCVLLLSLFKFKHLYRSSKGFWNCFPINYIYLF